MGGRDREWMMNWSLGDALRHNGFHGSPVLVSSPLCMCLQLQVFAEFMTVGIVVLDIGSIDDMEWE